MLHALSVLLLIGTPPSDPPVVTVRAHEFTFTAPKAIKSGPTTFRLVNEGKEVHHLTIIRMQPGKTVADYMKAVQTDKHPPGWALDVGGTNAVGPGAATQSTLILEPGEYALVCWLAAPGDATKTIHAAKGMTRSLTVTTEKNASTPPAADIEVRLNEYNFTLSKSLTPGHHVMRVVNDGKQPHELVLMQLAPGKSIRDILAWEAGGFMTAPPGQFKEGIANLGKNRSGYIAVDIVPGTYALSCYLADAKDGKPHLVHGMITELVVAAR
jgi:hypothetical protein